MTTAPTEPTARPLPTADMPAARAPRPAGSGLPVITTPSANGPEPTVLAVPATSTAQRLRAAGLWLRDTGLGGFGFALVLAVAFSGWAASFIGLHDFGHQHMGLTDHTAWLVPITFDGAPAGLSIVVARASTHGRSAPVWRLLIIAFTALSSWINYQHIEDSLGRTVAAFMPPSAVILFEGLMSEARAAAVRRMGRAAPRLHPLRWWFDFRGTRAIYRAYVLGLELPENLRTATVHTAGGPDRATPGPDRAVDRTAARNDGPDRTAVHAWAAPNMDRTAEWTAAQGDGPAAHGPDRRAVDRTAQAPTGPDRQRTTSGPSQVDRTAPADSAAGGPGNGPAAHPERTADRGPDRPATQKTTDRTARAGAAHTPGPARSMPAADRTATGDLALTDTEQEAVDRLRSAGRSISKRSIAEVVRSELDRSIASDRAAEIARHYRTLRSA
ncbi:DUF2637 domain-containing protein [Streptomyces sp.]|uniref:DUF2637 domain-containing protein n=1 Tax=Streptomyces sp. TaxID=1931 RepID=UPI002F414BF0